jgi:F-type H+-transporting ATPase subunit gamma
MANLKQIRQRIRSAKNIQQITRAMKLVAAARLKKATDRVLEARPYSDKLRDIMLALSGGDSIPDHPLMTPRQQVNKIAVIFITSDRGLAGSYNTNLLRRMSDWIKAQSVPVTLLAVGRKGMQFFSRRGVDVAFYHNVPSAGAQFEDATTVAYKAREMFESGEVDEVYICYSKFYSPIRQVPQIVQLLPIAPPKVEEGTPNTIAEYKFEPDPHTLLGTLLPRYYMGLVWQAMMESTASEHGARMSAMTSATDAAGKMIQELTLKANRERQTAITTEILEVVSGAEALNG